MCAVAKPKGAGVDQRQSTCTTKNVPLRDGTQASGCRCWPSARTYPILQPRPSSLSRENPPTDRHPHVYHLSAASPIVLRRPRVTRHDWHSTCFCFRCAAALWEKVSSLRPCAPTSFLMDSYAADLLGLLARFWLVHAFDSRLGNTVSSNLPVFKPRTDTAPLPFALLLA